MWRVNLSWFPLHFLILFPFPLYFLILFPFPLHFLILFPFPCSPAAGCSRLRNPAKSHGWCIFQVLGQNAYGQNANRKVGILSGLFLVGILSVPFFGWHFVGTISTCFEILPKSWNSIILTKCQNIFRWSAQNANKMAFCPHTHLPACIIWKFFDDHLVFWFWKNGWTDFFPLCPVPFTRSE